MLRTIKKIWHGISLEDFIYAARSDDLAVVRQYIFGVGANAAGELGIGEENDTLELVNN